MQPVRDDGAIDAIPIMLAHDASDDMFDTDLIPECNWLRQLLERPDADALLAESIKIDTAFRATLTNTFSEPGGR